MRLPPLDERLRPVLADAVDPDLGTAGQMDPDDLAALAVRRGPPAGVGEVGRGADASDGEVVDQARAQPIEFLDVQRGAAEGGVDVGAAQELKLPGLGVLPVVVQGAQPAGDELLRALPFVRGPLPYGRVRPDGGVPGRRLLEDPAGVGPFESPAALQQRALGADGLPQPAALGAQHGAGGRRGGRGRGRHFVILLCGAGAETPASAPPRPLPLPRRAAAPAIGEATSSIRPGSPRSSDRRLPPG